MNMNVIAAVAGSLVVGAAAFMPMGAAVSPDPLQTQSETAEETLATEPAVTDESTESTETTDDTAATDAPLVVPSFGPGQGDDDDEDEDEDEDDDDEDDEDHDDDEDDD